METLNFKKTRDEEAERKKRKKERKKMIDFHDF